MIITNQNIIGSLQRGVSSAPSFVGLLDTYSGAAVGYSLRKLRDAYSGECINVRRDPVPEGSDASKDIGFVNNVLDTTSLLAFVGSGDGYVTTWYDQSVNPENMTSSTASRQPKIVDAGVVLLENGKPILTSDGAGNAMNSDYMPDSGATNKCVFVVMKRNSSTKQCILGSYLEGNNFLFLMDNDPTNTGSVNLNVNASSERLNGSSWSYSSRTDVYNDLANQSIISTNAVFNFGSDASRDSLAIGYRYTNPINFEMTNMQELVIFENQTDQAAKDSVINSFYNAY